MRRIIRTNTTQGIVRVRSQALQPIGGCRGLPTIASLYDAFHILAFCRMRLPYLATAAFAPSLRTSPLAWPGRNSCLDCEPLRVARSGDEGFCHSQIRRLFRRPGTRFPVSLPGSQRSHSLCRSCWESFYCDAPAPCMIPATRSTASALRSDRED
jgi:hypothetical protein